MIGITLSDQDSRFWLRDPGVSQLKPGISMLVFVDTKFTDLLKLDEALGALRKRDLATPGGRAPVKRGSEGR